MVLPVFGPFTLNNALYILPLYVIVTSSLQLQHFSASDILQIWYMYTVFYFYFTHCNLFLVREILVEIALKCRFYL